MNPKKNSDKEFIVYLIVLLILLILVISVNSDNIAFQRGLQSEDVVEDLDSSLQQELDLADSDEDENITVSYDLDKTSIKINWLLLNNLDAKSNYFYSPYSISKTLAVLAQGATYETKEELNNLLVAGTSNRYTVPDSILASNSIWLQKSDSLIPDIEELFTNEVVEKYGTDVKIVDFVENTVDINKVMSDYVTEKTMGYIDDYNSMVTVGMKMNLLSTICLEDKLRFNIDNYKKHKFRGIKNTIKTDFIGIYNESFQYYRKGKLQGIILPFEDDLRLEIITSSNNTQKNILSMIKKMDDFDVNTFLSKLEQSNIKVFGRVFMPVLEMDNTVTKLPFILEENGLENVFNNSASYENISLDTEYYPSSLIHRAKLVDIIKGTVSEVKVEKPRNKRSLILDRPFYFIIKDRNRDLILFAGVVNDL